MLVGMGVWIADGFATVVWGAHTGSIDWVSLELSAMAL